jgi:hypothetical protein
MFFFNWLTVVAFAAIALYTNQAGAIAIDNRAALIATDPG